MVLFTALGLEQVAEAAITDLHLDGSLLVQAENPIGCLEGAPGHSPAR